MKNRSYNIATRIRKEVEIEKMLRAVGYSSLEWTFREAYEAFRGRIFGLRQYVTLNEMIDALDGVCRCERVGKYEPTYSD